MSELSINQVLKDFESVFGKMPAVRANNGDKHFERGDMRLIEGGTAGHINWELVGANVEKARREAEFQEVTQR